MKIIILDNFFNTSDYFKIADYSNKYLLFYNKFKLRNLIKKLLKLNNEISEIKIITTSKEKFYIDKNVKIELLSDFRLNIDRSEFENIKKKVIKEIRHNIIDFLTYLNNLKTFHIKGISIGKIIEAYLSIFLSESFGGYELVKKIFQVEKFNKVVLFNPNPNFLEFFRHISPKNNSISVYQDNFLITIRKIANLYRYAPYIPIRQYGLKKLFLEIVSKKKINSDFKNQKNIIFLANTQNQLNSIKPIYDYFKKEKQYNPIFYEDHTFLSSLGKYNELVKTIFQLRRIWIDNFNKMLKGMRYDSILIKGIMQDFYDIHLFLFIVSTFNNLYYFDEFFRYTAPLALIIAEELSAEGRLYTKYCKLKKIPTIYVPHAALPIYNELVAKTDFSCITVPGQLNKDFLINRGESREKIFVTGRARYDEFFTGNLKMLSQVNDMFNNKIYKFDPDRFTIIFTTNPIGFKATKKVVTSVINALNELNQINNLIIKLHPRENGLIYRKILKKMGIEPVIVKDYNIFELIKSSKVLLSMISTTILEAMIIGTPIILLDFVNLDFSFTGTYQFCQDKYVLIAKNQELLIEKLRELINNKDYYSTYSKNLKENGKKFCFYDEKASSTKIIHDLIIKTIEKNS